MKHWRVDFAVKIASTGEVHEGNVRVEADTIMTAILEADKTLQIIAESLAKVTNSDVSTMIWNVGIIEEDLF